MMSEARLEAEAITRVSRAIKRELTPEQVRYVTELAEQLESQAECCEMRSCALALKLFRFSLC